MRGGLPITQAFLSGSGGTGCDLLSVDSHSASVLEGHPGERGARMQAYATGSLFHWTGIHDTGHAKPPALFMYIKSAVT